MVHLLNWAFAGMVIGAVTWLIAPGRRALGLPAMLLLGGGGAVLGGLLSWSLWEFPAKPFWTGDLLTAPVLMSYLVAAAAALMSLTVGYGIVIRGS
jgi:uncharacterized membrane protein YeaQ/YmgE (transglycosylase-associated protein family)